MTKADLIEEVSRVVEMTRKDSEVIVETIFDSMTIPCARATKSRSVGSEASVRASGDPGSAVTRGLGRGWTCPPRESRTSSPAKN